MHQHPRGVQGGRLHPSGGVVSLPEPELRRQYLEACEKLRLVRTTSDVVPAFAAAVFWHWVSLDTEMLYRRLYRTRLMLAGSLLEAKP